MMMLQINSFNLFEVLAYFFMWTTFYFVLCLWNVARSYEWHCRTVTAIHGIVISSLAIYCTFRIGPWPFTDAGGPNSPMQIKIVSLCLGYFIFDFIWCVYFQSEGPAMIAHHVLSIIGMCWCLMSGHYGTELLATIGGAEITNPLLQLRWFIRETGRQNRILADVVEWVFLLMFMSMRIGFGSLLLYSYFQQDTDFWGRLGGVCIYLLGWIFFISILNYTIRKYTRRYQSWVSSSLPVPAKDVLSDEDKCDTNCRMDIITDKDIPSQSEIKYGNMELTLRKNCLVQESIES